MPARTSYPVQPATAEHLPFLWEMLYEAAHHRPLSDPAIALYLNGLGRFGDVAVVALDPDDGSRIGAAWYRLYPADNRGYGFVDASTPEIAVAVVPGRRGAGVGEALLRELLMMARSQGFETLSLSVRRDNPAAIKLYERHGFTKLSDTGFEHPSWVMRAELAASEDEGPRRTKAPAGKPRD